MRATAASIVLLLGCSSEADHERLGSKSQGQECSVGAASQFFRDATQVDYDYQPLSAAALVQASTLVVSAHVASVAEGPSEPPADHPVQTTLVTFRIDDVYKGAANDGDALRVHLPRAPVVTPDALRSLSTSVPADSVTLFLTSDLLHPGSDSFRLTTPQGLIVAAPCGTTQALDSATTFDPPVSSDTELASRVREAATLGPEAQCSATTTAKLIYDATRVTFDYQPLSPTQLVARSQQVVRGRPKALTLGGPRTTVLSITVDEVYKGPAKDGDTVRVSLSRSEAVTEAELKALSLRLGDASVTLFVYEEDHPYEPGLKNWLTSPQGLIVAADCGVAEALTGANAFGESVNSEAALDTAVRAASSSTAD